MTNPVTKADCLYVNGDSWTHGSELIDPNTSIQDHFDPVHERYRLAHYWPQLMADQLGLELVVNSEPGGSNERILRTTMYDVSQLIMLGRKPFVIVAWTQLQRFELPFNGGQHWRNFVGPSAPNEPRVAMDIWSKWSSDRTDVINWIQQLIALDCFLTTNGVDYLSTTVFRQIFQLFEQCINQEGTFFKPYLTQLNKHVKLNRHSLNLSMETYLSWHSDVTYGPGCHPLTRGHELLAEQLLTQIHSKFQFQRLQDL